MRIATRRSRLAMAQTQIVVDLVRRDDRLDVEIVPITTSGDRQSDRSLAEIGGDGVFVKELMVALLEQRADVAVHSLKDLPTTLPADVDAGAVPQREDPRDALVSAGGVFATLDQLPPRAVVGTSSLRRAAQLRLARPDVVVRSLRGNVDTRIGKVRDGVCDAAILAMAGLQRLGVADAIGAHPIDPDVMVPAVAQGAIFAQCRAADEQMVRLLATIDHQPSALATRMERTFLLRLGAGCVAPVGAHVRVEGDGWRLSAVVVAPDGSAVVRRDAHGRLVPASPAASEAQAVAAVEGVASEMLEAGAREIVASARQRGLIPS